MTGLLAARERNEVDRARIAVERDGTKWSTREGLAAARGKAPTEQSSAAARCLLLEAVLEDLQAVHAPVDDGARGSEADRDASWLVDAGGLDGVDVIPAILEREAHVAGVRRSRVAIATELRGAGKPGALRRGVRFWVVAGLEALADHAAAMLLLEQVSLPAAGVPARGRGVLHAVGEHALDARLAHARAEMGVVQGGGARGAHLVALVGVGGRPPAAGQDLALDGLGVQHAAARSAGGRLALRGRRECRRAGGLVARGPPARQHAVQAGLALLEPVARQRLAAVRAQAHPRPPRRVASCRVAS
eukprot:CAMPEP_0202073432 /NCGR_PEP_ID=MMETSP0964-20121228/3029_1 /ASSEMBLY_ACC=CAM_ASM_000500 /TAXON_ID=4773 /ORGANISM="Schizochytrium aggregatum, Strain ATCC28209" /LENGTH=303 /DNA_ID=CAMNT_0048640525 /DNA_START=45 /DNA_END=954 /DNA_ORIENTATION=+